MSHESESQSFEHPNYLLIWGVLVAALAVSVLMGSMELPVLGAVLIFTVAVAKAYLVARYYMHLKFEPAFVLGILVVGLGCLYFLFFGLVPDIVFAVRE